MADFDIKKNNTVPFITAVLENGLGVPANLTGSEVRFIMREIRSVDLSKVNGFAVIDDSANGLVHYEWQAADLDTPGGYEAVWRVTYQDGREESFPNDHPLMIAVHNDLREMSE